MVTTNVLILTTNDNGVTANGNNQWQLNIIVATNQRRNIVV